MAPSCSTQPFGDPGVLQMMARPQMPAIPRDNRPSGLTKRIASASPGASRSITIRVPSGVWSRGAKPVPPVDTTSPAKPPHISRKRVGDVVDPVGGDAMLDDDPARRRELLDEGCTAEILASAVNDPVADRENLGMKGLLAHGLRRYRISTMPSVSWSCGSTRQPCP